MTMVALWAEGGGNREKGGSRREEGGGKRDVNITGRIPGRALLPIAFSRLVQALLTLLLVTPLQAQQQVVPRDTVTLDAYLARVREFHPVARQARLLGVQAQAEQRIARGGFDPKFTAGWDRKTFGSTEYYDYAVAKLTVPTPLGADLVVGYERADGQYINPDRRTPTAGLLTAGISIPVGQRMITDERRTAIVVARALRDAAEGEAALAVNRLQVSAAKYWADWYEASRRLAIADTGLGLAEFRLEAVRRRLRSGEAPAIDTVEASLEVQRRFVSLVEARQALLVARLEAEAQLWGPGGDPAALPDDAVPGPATWDPAPPLDSLPLERWVAEAIRTHPAVRFAAGKTEQAVAERRFAAQGILPAAAFSATGIAPRQDAFGGGSLDGFTDPSLGNNAKVGAELTSSLLLLKERGKLQSTTAKLEYQEASLAKARRDVAVEVQAAAGAVTAFERMIAAQQVAVAQARALRDGEQRRFEAGESTLFLVNIRERVVLEEEAKLAAAEAKRVLAGVQLEAARGAVR